MPGTDSSVVEFRLGDLVRLRRVHPCGTREWLVDRLGADIGLRCAGCGRHIMLDRRTLERRLLGFVRRGDLEMSLAVAPVPRDAGFGAEATGDIAAEPRPGPRHAPEPGS